MLLLVQTLKKKKDKGAALWRTFNLHDRGLSPCKSMDWFLYETNLCYERVISAINSA